MKLKMKKLLTDERGQTVQDFAVGVSLLLVTVAFVFLLIPTITSPFISPGDADSQTQVERGSSILVGEYLSTSQTSSEQQILDSECTVAFFESIQMGGGQPDGAPANHLCGFDYSQTNDIKTLLNIETFNDVYIVIETSDGEVVTKDGFESDEVQLQSSNVSEVSSIASIERLVQLDGEVYTFRVFIG